MKYNPELRWALSKMHEHHLTFNSRVNMRLWMLSKGFCYIEIIKINQSLWKVYHIPGRVSRDEHQVLGSTSIPARLDTLVYWASFSWLTSVGTTRNTVIRLGWSRIGLAVLILHAAGVGLTGRPAVISGRYNKCHSLQLQNHYAHLPPLQHTRIHANTTMRNWSWGNDHGFRGIVCWPWQEESCVIG